MPNRDGTGPKGQGAKDGHGQGKGQRSKVGQGEGKGQGKCNTPGQGPMTGGKKGIQEKPTK